ncbi:F-BAR and double SH3 domains protein 2 isoform X1 [Lates japonicus]|uniref:F-BAR and double SH3 domains protein 2 isoform X1 n=1 Tax=Lates japonicus TaxID=270547 RepID=A0AAD3MNU8_LATJO|nr:F-BAR and double SH3 domains protein 2 isoform X1 [Lates japonicus]
MQPPPRKVKVTQELKNTHTEQMTRLHFKHQTECDLLEDMRYEQVSLPHACTDTILISSTAEELRNVLTDRQMI